MKRDVYAWIDPFAGVVDDDGDALKQLIEFVEAFSEIDLASVLIYPPRRKRRKFLGLF